MQRLPPARSSGFMRPSVNRASVAPARHVRARPYPPRSSSRHGSAPRTGRRALISRSIYTPNGSPRPTARGWPHLLEGIRHRRECGPSAFLSHTTVVLRRDLPHLRPWRSQFQQDTIVPRAPSRHLISVAKRGGLQARGTGRNNEETPCLWPALRLQMADLQLFRIRCKVLEGGEDRGRHRGYDIPFRTKTTRAPADVEVGRSDWTVAFPNLAIIDRL